MKTKHLVTVFFGLALLGVVVATPAAAQDEKKPPAFGLALSGFVKTDIFYDSRQTTNIREGHYLLYPKGPALGPDGVDANARGALNILSIQTRLAGKITGPDALGAKTSAYIEAEFFGTSDADLNGFRLRHGYLKLSWPRSELMVGQFWHPMFVTESYPRRRFVQHRGALPAILQDPAGPLHPSLRKAESHRHRSLPAGLRVERPGGSEFGLYPECSHAGVQPEGPVRFEGRESRDGNPPVVRYGRSKPKPSTDRTSTT